MSDARKKHPEERQDEVFLTNVSGLDFLRLGYRTKRLGKIAYDHNGNVIEGLLFPVFVSKSEYEEARR